MTDRGMEQFEIRFSERVRAYADRATERRIDGLAMSRQAMSMQHATHWSQRRLGAGPLGRGVGVGWAAVLVAVVLVGVVGVVIFGRLSDSVVGPQPTSVISSTSSPTASAAGPIPEVLRHAWQRPSAVTPGLDQWPSGFLRVASNQVEFGREQDATLSRSAATVAGPDILVVTTTEAAQGCRIGNIGEYRYAVEGQGTVMTLTAISPDACAVREEGLAGQWVRSDLPSPDGGGVAMPPGAHTSSAFDPFGEPGLSRRLSYTVPADWKVKEDSTTVFVLHHLPDGSSSQPSPDLFVSIFVQPRLAADFEDGASCGPVGAASGAGTGIDDIVPAIIGRPGVVSTLPTSMTIAGFEGQMLDVQLAPDWTRGCRAPEGPVVGMPLIVQEGSGGPVSGVTPDHPTRLILLDLGGDSTIAISIFSPEPIEQLLFDGQAESVMPVIESFEFHPATP